MRCEDIFLDRSLTLLVNLKNHTFLSQVTTIIPSLTVPLCIMRERKQAQQSKNVDAHSSASQAKASANEPSLSTPSGLRECRDYWDYWIQPATAALGTVANERLKKDVSLLGQHVQAIQSYVSRTPVPPKDTAYNLEYSIQEAIGILERLGSEIGIGPIYSQTNDRDNTALDNCTHTSHKSKEMTLTNSQPLVS